MKREIRYSLILACMAVVLSLGNHVEAKILTECQAVQELTKAKISRSLISNWVCLMESVSGLDTQLVTGPKTASSYNYGIFQISSLKWCSRGRTGGLCNKRCEDFANDDIQDDIECANKIQNTEGFKAWEAWVKKCKNKPLPNIGNCRRRRDIDSSDKNNE
ncbi:Lysozyme [Habropoda laboriosa]|uniref:lysozyme n=1 Tax=Habropoda laboriosa TaxID=597456 RepID=A0A0L7R6W1_9HYME|nr:PREDICTED: lysozyme-like [Habropoda laboriosa]KOC66564.1 Lysozyme [Habropoda laboriosa]